MKEIRLIATDLDGTFLKEDKSISKKNHHALQMLGSKNITRVAATGRNLQKVKQVIAPEIPFDYIVYSSGAGIYNWKDQKEIYSKNITSEVANQLGNYFVSKKLNFCAFREVPENHNFWYHRGETLCEEFNRYITYHNSLVTPLPKNGFFDKGLSQFLIIIKEDESSYVKLKTEIELQCKEIRVIRASSPITSGYIWVEIFNKSVSKGHGVEHICKMLGIDAQHTVGLGNDYNDLDLLKFTGNSFITENAADGIKNMFPLVPSNEKDGFAKLVQPIIL